MKKYFCLITLLVLFNCSDDETITSVVQEETLLGSWVLVETNSGTSTGEDNFVSVSSNKIIEFKSDNSIEISGDLCTMNSDSGDETTGTYASIDLGSLDGEIIPDDCQETSVYFEIIGRDLFLLYQCSLVCEQKYRKL